MHAQFGEKSISILHQGVLKGMEKKRYMTYGVVVVGFFIVMSDDACN